MAILHCAAKESEARVEQVLKLLIDQNVVPLPEKVIEDVILKGKNITRIEPDVPDVNLVAYDTILFGGVI